MQRVGSCGRPVLSHRSLFVPLVVVLLYTDVLSDENVPGDLAWMLGSVFRAVFNGAPAWRGHGSLLAGGLFILLNAEWWARTRQRASRWWQHPHDDGDPGVPPPAVPAGIPPTAP